MIEPYNLTQEQRDAAKITALEKQNADLISVLKMLAETRIGVHFIIDAIELIESNIDVKVLVNHAAQDCAAEAAQKVTEHISAFGELYERIAQYEQWFYRNNGGRSMR